MKNILFLILLIPAFSIGQVYTFQYTGNTYYHTQYRGGVGSDITLKVPVTDASTVFSFDMSGLVRLNNTLGAMQYHNGTSWNRLVDVSYGSTAYKPFSYTPSWSEVSGKPTFSNVATSGDYSDLINKPNLSLYYLASNPNAYISNLSGFNTSNLSEGTNLYWTQARFNAAFSGKSTTDLTEGTKLFFTQGRFDASFAAKTTDALPEGSANKYDKTVSITGTNGNIVSGTYPNFTISKKRQETYSGTTSAGGTYTVTFGTPYSAAPNIQVNIINGTDSQNIRTTSITTTGFTVLVRNRVDVVGLLPTWNNVSGATVDILVTEK